MAGKKQHYIPQGLLRNFGFRKKGKKTQVAVFSKSLGVFTTSTAGIAAERFFYSEMPNSENPETLDDKITQYENRIFNLLTSFITNDTEKKVAAREAAEVATHLSIRQKHLRLSISLAYEKLIDGSADIFGDVERTKQKLGINEVLPSGFLKDEFSKFYLAYEIQLSMLGFSQESFIEWAFQWSKDNFDENFSSGSEELQSILKQISSQTDDIARSGHTKALEQSLSPEERIKFLQTFQWKTISRQEHNFLLPDCVATSYSRQKGFMPLTYVGQDFDAVFIPISNTCLLIGERVRCMVSIEELNKKFAACSFDFFVTSEHTTEFEMLISEIGTRSQDEVNDMMQEALDQPRWT